MGFHLPVVDPASQIFKRIHTAAKACHAPKCHLAVHVGETEKSRLIVPVSYLNHPIFQKLLSKAEEEFGYRRPMESPAEKKLFSVLLAI